MKISEFITSYQEAFGTKASLPIIFEYSDIPVSETEKIQGCMFKIIEKVRQGKAISLCSDTIGCGGGKFYAGFTPMPEKVPNFVSNKERYKETPELVKEFIEQKNFQLTNKKYLNLIRVDKADNFDNMEGLLFFATPDILSGLAFWAYYDNNDDNAVCSIFGSGCSNIIAMAVRENKLGGNSCYIGLLDPSVRPHINEYELSFVIPRCRFEKMKQTMRECCLFDTHAWTKVKERINKK